MVSTLRVYISNTMAKFHFPVTSIFLYSEAGGRR